MQYQQQQQPQDRNIRPRVGGPGAPPPGIASMQPRMTTSAVAAPTANAASAMAAPTTATPLYYQTRDKAHLPPKEIAEMLVQLSLSDGNKKIETEYWAESLLQKHTISLAEVKGADRGAKTFILMKNDQEWTSPLSNIQEFACAIVDPVTKAQLPMRILVAKTMNSVYFVRQPIRLTAVTQQELNSRSADSFGMDDFDA